MRGALHIGTFFGIPVKVHWTFGLLLIWVVVFSLSSGLDLITSAVALAIVLGLFLCVVLHEYGHALTARRFGVETRDIILSPIGGLARLTHIPESPWKEIAIAIAGPAVNLVIAALLLALAFLLTGQWADPFSPLFWTWNAGNSLLVMIAKVNLILMLFNLLPAFPMDGGRVFRASLALATDRLRATAIASRIGQLFGLALVTAFVYGLLFQQEVLVFGANVSSVITAFIGVFVIIAARTELRQTRAKHELRKITVLEIFDPGMIPVSPETPLSRIEPYMNGRKRDHIVAEGNRIFGVLFSERLSEWLASGSEEPSPAAGSEVSQLFEPVQTRQSVAEVLELFLVKGYRIVPVYSGERLVGQLTRDDLNAVVQKVYGTVDERVTEPQVLP